MELKLNNLQGDYRTVVATLATNGQRVAPRGAPTREIRGVELVVNDITRCLPVGVGRELNTKIAAVEALQLMGGVLHPELLVRASSNFAEFMDGGTYHGGYGQRVRAQLPVVMKRLTEEPETRRAVLTIWDPAYDLYTEGVRDYPCTIALQFLVRNDELELHTHMRSNDVWRGLAYDAFVFTQLQAAVANALGLAYGQYHHHVTSLHIYEADLPQVDRMLSNAWSVSPFHLGGLPAHYLNGDQVQSVARAILRGETLDESVVNVDVAEWYEKRIHELRS